MTKSTITPCFNRVLIQLINPPESLIELPDDGVSPEASIVVSAVGPDVKCCKPGDRVMLVPGANILGLKGHEISTALIHDTSIIAILS